MTRQANLPLLQRLAQAPDPGLDGRRPETAEQWAACGAALGLEGLVPGLVEAGLLKADRALLRECAGTAALAAFDSLRLLQATVEVLSALEQAGIRAVPLKGPLLGARLYPEPLVRRSSDVDVLIGRAQLRAAVAALGTLGYVTHEGAQYHAHLRHHHHIHLSRPGAPVVEVHFAALHAFGSVIPSEELLDRAVATTVAVPGAAVWQGLLLRPVDELCYLCAHAASHHFERPIWSLDVAALLATMGEVDWGEVLRLARRWRMRLGISAALRSAVRQLGPSLAGAGPAPDRNWKDPWTDRGRDRIRALPAGDALRFGLSCLCLVVTCDDAWRSLWVGQHLVLGAVGTVAARLGHPLPDGWPPLPPTAPARSP